LDLSGWMFANDVAVEIGQAIQGVDAWGRITLETITSGAKLEAASVVLTTNQP
jgi:hypothetical protein